MKRTYKPEQSRGFTLVELAVVIAIIGLLLGGLLDPLANQVEGRRVSDTQNELREIKEALYGFVLTNGRLPCPDKDDATADGTEDRIPVAAPVACEVAEGLLPWTDLGVTERDSWNNRFRYIVDIHFADDDDGMDILPDGPAGQPPHPPPGPGELHSECDGQTPTVGVSLQLCSSGHITIFDAEGTYDDPTIPGAPDSNQVAINVPALVISRGANGGLAPVDLVSLHEIENTNGDDIFVSRDFSNQGGWEYDDVLIWISPNVLKSKLVTANLLP